tara:strand:- start:2408 stop:2749 length:342 start_codon:yes stop_codon:yes gene_type:complete
MSWKDVLKMDKEELFRRLKDNHVVPYGRRVENFDEMMDYITKEINGKTVFKPESTNFTTKSKAKRYLNQKGRLWLRELGFDVEPIEDKVMIESLTNPREYLQDGKVRYYFVKQ